MYSSFDISKKILQLAKEDAEGVDPMKLLKLVYITHGWYLGFYDKPLISDAVQAWKYGPVIPDLYHILKPYGSEYLDLNLLDLFSDVEIDEKDSEFIKVIWKIYKSKSGLELSSLTHQDGTPWKETYIPGINGLIIPNEKIKNHYKDKIERAKERTESNKTENA